MPVARLPRRRRRPERRGARRREEQHAPPRGNRTRPWSGYDDGSIRNKIGTRPLAEAARRVGVRTVVACELLKLAAVPPPSLEDEPELRDTTPPEFLDEIVTEEGPVVPEDVRSVIERTPFLRDGYRLLQR